MRRDSEIRRRTNPLSSDPARPRIAMGGRKGRVEVFAASDAIRGTSMERINAYEDERRPWTHVTREGELPALQRV